ncbi:DUF6415 family natural product biosynthesis protein [Streptomyces goshikiensis]|uniref:DUF6415 family natural product biosynthesis protein n=1 Tax=Streptomyces goshikiensis TaxID=1942 RepID=UPI0036AA6499
MSGTHIALYDPEGHLGGELPLDRASHERMVKAVLGWPADPAPCPADLEQITLRLTGAAHVVADDVRHAAGQLTDGHTARARAAAVLAEAQHRLAAAPQGTVPCAQSHARLVRTLYEHLDHLTEAGVLRLSPAAGGRPPGRGRRIAPAAERLP